MPLSVQLTIKTDNILHHCPFQRPNSIATPAINIYCGSTKTLYKQQTCSVTAEKKSLSHNPSKPKPSPFTKIPNIKKTLPTESQIISLPAAKVLYQSLSRVSKQQESQQKSTRQSLKVKVS